MKIYIYPSAFILILCLSVSLIAEIGHAEANLNSQYSRDQKNNTERGVRRERSIDVNHSRTHQHSHGGESTRRRERANDQTMTHDFRREQSAKQDESITVAWVSLSSMIIARIERGEIGYGIVASALRREPVFTKPCIPRLPGTFIRQFKVNCHSKMGKPNTYPKYRNIKANQGLMPRLIAAYYGRMLLVRAALDDLTDQGHGQIRLSETQTPNQVLTRAILDHMSDMDILKAAWEMGLKMAEEGCRVPTDVSVSADGISDFQCGALKVEPLSGTAVYAGSYWTGGSDVGGIKYASTISKNRATTYARSESSTARSGNTISRSSYRRHSSDRNDSVSTAIRRGRSLSRTGAQSSGRSTAAGITAKPQQ